MHYLLFFENYYVTDSSSNEDASTTNSGDSSLGSLREVLSLDDDGLVGESTLSENLEETGLGNIDHGDLKQMINQKK